MCACPMGTAQRNTHCEPRISRSLQGTGAIHPEATVIEFKRQLCAQAHQRLGMGPTQIPGRSQTPRFSGPIRA